MKRALLSLSPWLAQSWSWPVNGALVSWLAIRKHGQETKSWSKDTSWKRSECEIQAQDSWFLMLPSVPGRALHPGDNSWNSKELSVTLCCLVPRFHSLFRRPVTYFPSAASHLCIFSRMVSKKCRVRWEGGIQAGWPWANMSEVAFGVPLEHLFSSHPTPSNANRNPLPGSDTGLSILCHYRHLPAPHVPVVHLDQVHGTLLKWQAVLMC